MFTADITLAGDASSTRTYALRGYPDGASLRGVSSAGLAVPETLRISHTVSKPKAGGAQIDRHLVRLDLSKRDATTGQQETAAVYVVIEFPRAVSTLAQVKDMVTQLKNFLTGANVELLCNGEL